MQRTPLQRTPTERGSVTLIVVAGLATAITLALGVVRLGDVAAGQARADAVADLTALAAVTGGDAGAQQVARSNGASITAQRRVGSTEVVTVSLAGRSAMAAARPSG